MTKKELLGELYSIRAGLSQIALLNDEDEKLKSKLKAEKKTLDDYKGEADMARRSYLHYEEMSKIDVEKASVSSGFGDFDVDDTAQKHSGFGDFDIEEEPERKKSVFMDEFLEMLKYLLPFAFIAAFILYFVWALILDLNPELSKNVNNAFNTYGDNIVSAIYLGLITGPVITLIIIVFIALIKHINAMKVQRAERIKLEKEEKEKEEKKKALAAAQKQKRFFSKLGAIAKLGESKQKMEEAKDKYDKALVEYNEVSTNLNNNRSALKTIANLYFDVLSTLYSETIDIRDWKYIDLIIYYIETGRAKTVQEALLLVDNQKNVEAIIDAIGMATEEISENINRTYRSLKNEMSSNFNRIYSDLNNAISEQNENNSIIDAKFNELYDNQKASDAMIKKISVGSEELYVEVKNIINDLK